MSMLLGYLTFFNFFFGFGAAYTLELYLGLAVFSLYIAADTQLIVNKAASGRYDVVSDAMALFADLVQVFVRILVILMKKEEKKEKERRKRK